MIRTAEQILADIAAAGGDVGPEDRTTKQRWDAHRQSSLTRKAQTVSAGATIPAPAEPTGVKMCAVPGCHNKSPERTYCGTHRRRKSKYGDVQADKPLRCRCGACPRTIRRKRQQSKVEQVGDVWLSPVV